MFPYRHNGSSFGYLCLWNNRQSADSTLPFRRITFNPWRPELRPLWIQKAALSLHHATQQSEVRYALAV